MIQPTSSNLPPGTPGYHPLDQVLEASGAGVWKYELGSGRLVWSGRMKAIFGFPPDGPSPTQAQFLQSLHPQDRPAVEAAFGAALHDHQDYALEYRITWPDGSEHWIESHGRGEYDASGEPLSLMGVARDISQRKQAELAPKQSEERFRALVESTSQVVWIASPKGELLELSPAFERYTGLDPLHGASAGWNAVTHPDDRDRTIAAWTRCVASGEPYECEFRARVADGTYRRLRSYAVPLHCADGSIREWIGTATDIEEGKQAEEALRRANEELRQNVTQLREAERATQRLNRVYSVLSGIDALIIRAHNQADLFEGACRIAVGQGQFLLAWIGMVRGDRIVPVAVNGKNEGYVEENIHISLRGDDASTRGPTATALRERRPRVCNDIAADPDFAPWREAALRRGFRSSAALPLLSENRLVGCICLYAAEAGFFDTGEMKLLEELADDISHALDFIAHAEQLDYLAYYDGLTGLANRHLFSDRLDQFAQAARQTGDTFAIIMLEPTNFKSVNESYGMAAGDELLRRMARRLRHFAGGNSRLARVGGDRFACIVPDFHASNHAGALLRERVWEGMSRPYKVSGQKTRISVRIGIAVFPGDGNDAERLLQNAEAALKKAKVLNENVLFYTQQMSIALKERLHLEGRMRHALEHSEFVLHYQPKLNVRSGAICGTEALLRWNNPELGLVPPAKFMELLEETSLIVKVGRWILHQAAADQLAWRGAGLDPPRVAVNISLLQLRQPGFVDEVRTAINDKGLAASDMELEVTESILLPDMERHVAKLHQLHSLGVSISIDDFGTGYSSLSRLLTLPVDELKIDRSFIVDMIEDADMRNIVSTIISLARSMHLRVVAEGVESLEQLDCLDRLCCDEFQGYLFSPPVPAAEFAEMLRQGRRMPRQRPAPSTQSTATDL
ncbi:sensor domain-containing protein [Nevskia soli]|uniref:sensor domain-containing protein n=1 Tax=Nevskia soli TaxID=418856 RepID=UPI000A076CA6|nr:GGDEF domain-containing phosphodiesterase [Nevskia soli]